MQPYNKKFKYWGTTSVGEGLSEDGKLEKEGGVEGCFLDFRESNWDIETPSEFISYMDV